MKCPDMAYQCIFFAAHTYLPCRVFRQPAQLSVYPDAYPVDVMPAHVILIAHMREIDVTHRPVRIQRYAEFAIGEDDRA